MANRNDGLAEVLVQLAGNAATLIERARASAAFKAAQTVDGEATEKKAAAAPAADDGRREALQNILVEQAVRIRTLETELEQLKSALAAAIAKPTPRKAATKKKPVTKKAATA